MNHAQMTSTQSTVLNPRRPFHRSDLESAQHFVLWKLLDIPITVFSPDGKLVAPQKDTRKLKSHTMSSDMGERKEGAPLL